MKIRSKIMLGLYSILLPMVLFTTPTFAYNHFVGDNIVHNWGDEFTIVTNTVATSTASFTKNNLSLGSFTILFYESVVWLTVPSNRGVDILVGEHDFGYYYSENTSLMLDHYIIDHGNVNDTSIAELQGLMIYVEDFNNMESPGDFAIRLVDSLNYNMQTFMEIYAYIIYDTPDNILTNTIDYYYALGESDGAEAGYQDGQDDMFAQGSTNFGYNVVDSYDYADGESEGYVSGAEAGYQDGQDDMFAQGSTNFGYNVVDAFDYELGYDNGYDDAIDEPVEASGIQFMEDFKTWIVPALLLVILVGGAISVIAKKKRDDE